uniref:Uncharacterized protein n=1 Tax=Aegilops tauschii subsp. strangulata TaxID=200361 RepID=A0A453B0Y7_AEGTS
PSSLKKTLHSTPLPREEIPSPSSYCTHPHHRPPHSSGRSSSLSSSPALQFENSHPRAQTPNPSRSGPALRPAGPVRGTCGIWAHGDRPRSDLLLRRRRRRRVVGGQEGPPHRQLERRGAYRLCFICASRGCGISSAFVCASLLDFGISAGLPSIWTSLL